MLAQNKVWYVHTYCTGPVKPTGPRPCLLCAALLVHTRAWYRTQCLKFRMPTCQPPTWMTWRLRLPGCTRPQVKVQHACMHVSLSLAQVPRCYRSHTKPSTVCDIRPALFPGIHFVSCFVSMHCMRALAIRCTADMLTADGLCLAQDLHSFFFFFLAGACSRFGR